MDLLLILLKSECLNCKTKALMAMVLVNNSYCCLHKVDCRVAFGPTKLQSQLEATLEYKVYCSQKKYISSA